MNKVYKWYNFGTEWTEYSLAPKNSKEMMNIELSLQKLLEHLQVARLLNLSLGNKLLV